MSKAKAVVTNSPKKQPQQVTPISIDVLESFTTKPPELDFVFCGLLTGSVGALVSPGGTGKSMLALNIALAVATGYDLTGGALDVLHTGKVTYLNSEDDYAVLRSRLYSIGKFLSPEIQNVAAESFSMRSLKGENGGWLLDDSGKENQQAIDCLLKESDGQRLVILDTLRRFHLADENSSGQMSHLLSVLENVAKKTGCTFLYLHHSPKYASINGFGDQQAASRGSSVLVDNARYQANLVGMTVSEAHEFHIPKEEVWKYVKFVGTKVNYKAKGGETWLYRDHGGVLTRANVNTNNDVQQPLLPIASDFEPTEEPAKAIKGGNYEVKNFTW